MALPTQETERGTAATASRSVLATPPGPPLRTAFAVEVPIAPGTARATTLTTTITGWIFPPANERSQKSAAAWYLGIPGASYRGLGYFDRQVSGYTPEEFSIARSLAQQGIGFVVIDTLGAGESLAEVDGELITHSVTAAANAQVLDGIRERLTTGRLVDGLEPVAADVLFLGAFGRSMGAFQLTQLAALLEGRGTPLDAAIFVGCTHNFTDFEHLGLGPDALSVLGGMEATNGYYVLPRPFLRPMFYGPNPSVPAALIEADERGAIAFPKGLLDEGFTPGYVAQESGAISCPVLFVAAAHDLSPNALAEGAYYRSSRLFTAYTQPRVAHCNFELSRYEYWRVVAAWTRMAAASRDMSL